MSEKPPFAALLRGLSGVLERLADSTNTQSESTPQATSKRGFSMRTLDGSGLEDLKELASRLQEKAAEPIPQKRTLHLEVHAEAKEVVVMVHEPALQAKLLQISIDGDMLELSADQPNAQYYGEALLPCAVKASSQVLVTHAGVIELRWHKLRPNSRPPGGAS